ncbi:RNA polymerase factor sigma-54 [Enterococcus sp. BWR-S5]|uniref:RNA polymerase factor sigma-54 n=1 Tax=Enterococcus sp. BWR-S5 TaxID=2787714 RepID=UPI00192054E5|nr:RNA polymerase factor sigma-54 [Enterococcus sp. BWR-S5]MBL1223903.1 RNA polymerase factor sigma-54 [Enterococcus sp. BWR-S5]
MKFEQHLSQQQKQVQKLAMTQQLQQSIQVLQYNAEELQTFIENKALENPLIELQNNVNDYTYSGSSSGQYNNDKESNLMNQIPDSSLSLFEYMIEQIHLNYRDTFLRKLVLFLAEFIDLNGYLTISLEKAAEQTGADSVQILDALVLLQQLDPAGVGARDLKECLLLQIERDDYSPALAYIILEEEFEAFANKKWAVISKKFDIALTEVQEVFDYVQTLTPSPGSVFGSTAGLYVRPDLKVKIVDGHPFVVSNKEGAPTIRFQQAYFSRMEKTADPEVQEYISEKKKEFEWLQKTIVQRGDTILRVGTEIVERQQDFFLKPERPLKPMTLKEIAQTLDIHESTVSRSVNGKYLETEFGSFELRSFFSQGLASSDDGEDTSANDVKRQIKQLIEQEDKAKPISDQKLVEKLKENNIEIARRTVAKYREALNIPSSSKRKRYD